MHVGGNRSSASAGDWRWVGRITDPVDITYWGGGQPDADDDAEFCMANNKDKSYGFIDTDCAVLKYFICEK